MSSYDPVQVKAAARAMTDYAMANAPPAHVKPDILGLFSGWPLSELASTCFGPNWGSTPLVVAAVMHLRKHHEYGTGVLAYPEKTQPTLNDMLMMRMRWSHWGAGFEHVALHRTADGDQVHIWIVTQDGQSHVLQDGYELFPSDALVTKLNMLKQG